MLSVSGSTVCRELKRNRGKRGYRPKQAQIKADKRRAQAAKALKMTAETIGLIDVKIVIDWSPGQISGWLKVDQGIIQISHERIYRGDWEIDTVIGKNHQGALVTLVDRVSKFTLIKKGGQQAR